MEEDLRTPLAGSSRGRYLLLKGLGRRCTADDVMKLFHGFELMSAAVSMVRVCSSPAPLPLNPKTLNLNPKYKTLTCLFV